VSYLVFIVFAVWYFPPLYIPFGESLSGAHLTGDAILSLLIVLLLFVALILFLRRPKPVISGEWYGPRRASWLTGFLSTLRAKSCRACGGVRVASETEPRAGNLRKPTPAKTLGWSEYWSTITRTNCIRPFILAISSPMDEACQLLHNIHEIKNPLAPKAGLVSYL
jgi:hypothetical protein